MRALALGVASTFCCIVAFAAAGTAIGVALEDSSTGGRSYSRWVDSVVLIAGGVSALCAAAAICCQATRCSSLAKPCGEEDDAATKPLTAAALLSAVGLAAHASMLTCLSVYWRYLAFRVYYQSYGGNSERGHQVRRQINYFEYFSRWSPQEQALYSFGCVAGTCAWLFALLLTLWDLVACWSEAADIPLTAALLGGSSPHLLPVTSPHSGGSSLLGCDALLASPRDEASPRGRRKAAYREAVGAYSQGGSAVFIPALVRLRPT